MRKHNGLPWRPCTAVSLLPAVFAANAGATDCTQTTYPYASPSYTNYDCPTGDDYLVFGKVWVEGVPGSGIYGLAGIGICQFESSGSWDKGDDHLRLCDNTSGPSWDCSDNEGRADGREGADTIYGTYLSEDLWGGSGTYIDDLYGNDGSDHIYAGPGDDNIWAGAGNDWVYGEDGPDAH